MSSATSLEELVTRRRVLVVNAIRGDVPSGGNTCTQVMLSHWRTQAQCVVEEFDINPRADRSMLAFALATFPAAVFVQLGRLTGRVWLEFLFRASPWLFLRCLWVRWRRKPEVVVFNHHASFLYRFAFTGCHCVLVWHDVPSLKRDESRDTRKDKRWCALFERLAIRGTEVNATFSFNDARALRLLHHRASVIVPVIDLPPMPRSTPPQLGRWLLVGNWTRAENTEGAEAFLLSCIALKASGAATNDAIFHIAGHGSQAFVNRLHSAHPSLQTLQLQVTARYGDMREFKEMALLAPLLRGAGIKLKTIEAWAAGIPVVGTAQAFTGMPPHIWRRGGLRAPTIEAMARICLSDNTIASTAAALDPIGAYRMYRQAVRDSAS